MLRVTKPWFEITVPLMTPGITVTLNVMVATLAGLLDASAGIEPGVALAGELMSMPFTRGDSPPESGTATPFKRGAARDISRVHRHKVSQHDIHGIAVADVLRRDRVTQRLTGEQEVRVARQIRGDLLQPEDWPTRLSPSFDLRRPRCWDSPRH